MALLNSSQSNTIENGNLIALTPGVNIRLVPEQRDSSRGHVTVSQTSTDTVVPVLWLTMEWRENSGRLLVCLFSLFVFFCCWSGCFDVLFDFVFIVACFAVRLVCCLFDWLLFFFDSFGVRFCLLLQLFVFAAVRVLARCLVPLGVELVNWEVLQLL